MEEINHHLTKEKAEVLEFAGYIKKNDQMATMLLDLSDAESTLWMRAWLCKPGRASNQLLKQSLVWTDSKLRNTLATLCKKGWGYRMKYPEKPNEGYFKEWFLPFLAPLPEKMRSARLLRIDQLPEDIQKSIPDINWDSLWKDVEPESLEDDFYYN